MDIMTDILQWLLPGGALGTLVTWLLSRKTFYARNKKEREDIYKSLYDSLKETVGDIQQQNIQLIDENNEIRNRLQNINAVIRQIGDKANRCRYWSVCPVAKQLQVYRPAGTVDSHRKGQHDASGYRERQLRSGREKDSDPDTHGQPP